MLPTHRIVVPLLAAFLAVACAEAPDGEPGDAPGVTAGERQVRTAHRGSAGVTMRSGPEVPVALPPGFTLYPGARVTANTVVDRRGRSHILLEFASADSPSAIMRFYRAQATKAGVRLTLDLAGSASASLGGELAEGGLVSVSARRQGQGSKVVIAFD